VGSRTEAEVDQLAPTGLGQIEYRLARDSAVRSVRRGQASRLDVCDAQPELVRVAANLGQPTDSDCPICEEAKLVNVLFAFGRTLPAQGRALENQAELKELAKTDDIAFYVVEVCLACRWNHLLRSFTSQTARRRARTGRS
jgi:hypothetical protein